MKVLVLDVGGTHVKMLVTGKRQHCNLTPGPRMTAKVMVAGVKKAMSDAGGIRCHLDGLSRPRAA
jgi:polyphosphate glucokinase